MHKQIYVPDQQWAEYNQKIFCVSLLWKIRKKYNFQSKRKFAKKIMVCFIAIMINPNEIRELPIQEVLIISMVKHIAYEALSHCNYAEIEKDFSKVVQGLETRISDFILQDETGIPDTLFGIEKKT